MMEKKNYRLEIITPEKTLLRQEVISTVLPTGKGMIGVLPGHAPLIGTVTPGILKASDDSQKDVCAFVNSGFFMVSSDKLTIITQSAELDNQIDNERAREAKERAQNIIDSKDPSMDMERARESLLRAETRMKLTASKETAH